MLQYGSFKKHSTLVLASFADKTLKQVILNQALD